MPGPRYELTDVRFALSYDALKINGNFLPEKWFLIYLPVSNSFHGFLLRMDLQ